MIAVCGLNGWENVLKMDSFTQNPLRERLSGLREPQKDCGSGKKIAGKFGVPAGATKRLRDWQKCRRDSQKDCGNDKKTAGAAKRLAGIIGGAAGAAVGRAGLEKICRRGALGLWARLLPEGGREKTVFSTQRCEPPPRVVSCAISSAHDRLRKLCLEPGRSMSVEKPGASFFSSAMRLSHSPLDL